MSKKSKKMLTATAIVSFVVGFIMLIATILLLFNVSGMKDYVRDVIAESLTNESDINFELSVVLVDFVVGTIYNIYAGIYYLRYAKTKSVMLGGYKAIMYVSLFQLFFMLSVIPSIMGMVASNYLKSDEMNVANGSEQKPMSDISEKIAFLKEQKTSGAISEEQYNAMLNKAIEEEAMKNNDKNSQ